MEEVEQWDIDEKAGIVPDKTVDVAGHTTYHKINLKSKRVILDVVKDHIVPHIARKENAFEM